jgi:hypothetical protein
MCRQQLVRPTSPSHPPARTIGLETAAPQAGVDKPHLGPRTHARSARADIDLRRSGARHQLPAEARVGGKTERFRLMFPLPPAITSRPPGIDQERVGRVGAADQHYEQPPGPTIASRHRLDRRTARHFAPSRAARLHARVRSRGSPLPSRP